MARQGISHFDKFTAREAGTTVLFLPVVCCLASLRGTTKKGALFVGAELWGWMVSGE
jgi:hypothetical protein